MTGMSFKDNLQLSTSTQRYLIAIDGYQMALAI